MIFLFLFESIINEIFLLVESEQAYTYEWDLRKEKDDDVKELHDRIDTVLEKMEHSNEKIMNEFKSLREAMTEHNSEEKLALDKLNQWKWMIAGGILVLSWLISHVNLDTLMLK